MKMDGGIGGVMANYETYFDANKEAGLFDAAGLNRDRSQVRQNTTYGVNFMLSPAAVLLAARLGDVLGFMLSGAAIFLLSGGVAARDPQAMAVGVVFVATIYALLADRGRFYSLEAIMRPLLRMDDILIATVLAAIALAGAALAFGAAPDYAPAWIAGFTALSFVTIVLLRYGARAVALALSRRGVIGSNMAVLGAGLQAQQFLRKYEKVGPYFSVITGVFDIDAIGGVCAGHTVRGNIDTLVRLVRSQKIDNVVIAMPLSGDVRITEAIERLKELPVNVHLSTELVGYELNLDPAPGDFAAFPMFAVSRRPISGASFVLKAIEDIVLASVALVALLPLFLLVAALIKLDSRGPVFFKQKRLGFNNKPFEIFKFRSMYHHHAPDGEGVVQQATKRDPRVTRIGRILRATSLDELPQLLNVLNGSMSLVGPRPHALSHNEEYGRIIRGYFSRHRVKPGITGLAQVKGLRGETSDIRLMEERIRYDIEYANNWSLFLDIKILVMTVLVVLFQKSAY